jgi:hypothetical protein
MNMWELAIIKIVMSLGGTVSLRMVYNSLEEGDIIGLNENHLRETKWQNRPAYQHQVRKHISNLTQAGDLSRISRGKYAITEKGRKRLNGGGNG